MSDAAGTIANDEKQYCMILFVLRIVQRRLSLWSVDLNVHPIDHSDALWELLLSRVRDPLFLLRIGPAVDAAV